MNKNEIAPEGVLDIEEEPLAAGNAAAEVGGSAVTPQGQVAEGDFMKLQNILGGFKSKLEDRRRAFESEEGQLKSDQEICHRWLKAKREVAELAGGVEIFKQVVAEYLAADAGIGFGVGAALQMKARSLSLDAWQPYLLQGASIEYLRSRRKEITDGFSKALRDAEDYLERFRAEHEAVLRKYGLI